MTTTRIGASKKYSQNWGLAFRQKSTSGVKKGAQKAAPAAPGKAAKKPAAKGRGR